MRSLAIFADDADRRLYIEHMREECGRQGCRILAWCLMTNHVHLVVVPEREAALSEKGGLAEADRRGRAVLGRILAGGVPGG